MDNNIRQIERSMFRTWLTINYWVIYIISLIACIFFSFLAIVALVPLYVSSQNSNTSIRSRDYGYSIEFTAIYFLPNNKHDNIINGTMEDINLISKEYQKHIYSSIPYDLKYRSMKTLNEINEDDYFENVDKCGKSLNTRGIIFKIGLEVTYPTDIKCQLPECVQHFFSTIRKELQRINTLPVQHKNRLETQLNLCTVENYYR
ncbi:unnamed protein product [Adineta steineri]|uniref:Uncharacterized protein n=1 Tax=Adineta steineri TaxID=433720 RepID=A0A815L759_9BILA|nr:unnamed protein product [Adineta steineri]